MVEKIIHIYEPDDLQCGQTVIAMLTGKSVEQIVEECGNKRETTLKEMRECLKQNGMEISQQRSEAYKKEDLPRVALLSLETPRCWHWSLYFDGVFYDPEHGILSDFPESNRKYFWNIEEK